MPDSPLHDTTKPIYPLRVAAELSGTSVYTLRQYADLGLVLPYKTQKNRRLYSQVDIKRLLCIRKYLDGYGLNIAGIKAIFAQVPCWLLHPCTKEDQAGCDAYSAFDKPCWQASNKGDACKNEDCRKCTVYRLPERCVDIKSLFKQLEVIRLKNAE